MSIAMDAGRNPRTQEHDCSLPASSGRLKHIHKPMKKAIEHREVRWAHKADLDGYPDFLGKYCQRHTTSDEPTVKTWPTRKAAMEAIIVSAYASRATVVRCEVVTREILTTKRKKVKHE